MQSTEQCRNKTATRTGCPAPASLSCCLHTRYPTPVRDLPRQVRAEGGLSQKSWQVQQQSGRRISPTAAFHSFEYLHQSPLVTLLDGANPRLLILQIQNVNRERASIRRKTSPDGTRRRRDYTGERGKAIRVTQVQRNFHET